MNVQTPVEQLKPADYASDQEVRWCPGCGDYAIVKSVQRTMADLNLAPENTVFISGIGCAARFPYYMATYGFHTIHGRAPAIATGTKLANPELDIWVVMGDGDCLSIGGNHTLHAIRRNVDIQMLLFNNEIYGLTKGQYSPTSRLGTRSPSTPQGSVDAPVNATVFALGAGARFVARSVDTNQKHLPEMLKRAHAHRGASFLEIIQNCIVYNDGAFSGWTDKAAAADSQILVEHGEKLIFGKDGDKGPPSRPRLSPPRSGDRRRERRHRGRYSGPRRDQPAARQPAGLDGASGVSGGDRGALLRSGGDLRFGCPPPDRRDPREDPADRPERDAAPRPNLDGRPGVNPSIRGFTATRDDGSP